MPRLSLRALYEEFAQQIFKFEITMRPGRAKLILFHFSIL